MIKEHKKIRNQILKKGWEENKDKIKKRDFIAMFVAPVSVPTLYRISKDDK